MPTIGPDDRGFALGHGLFETILWEGHRLIHWEAHIARLSKGCKVLGLPQPNPSEARETIEAALQIADYPGRAAIRLNYSAGPGDRGLDPPEKPQPRLTAHASKFTPPEGPVSLFTAKVRRNDRSPISKLKTLAYLDNVLARAEAKKAGADEALMLNTRGVVACAAAANVYWVVDDTVCTPTLACGVLDGIVRGHVLSTCRRIGVPLKQVRWSRKEIEGAPMFITNSLIGLRTVSRLDGVKLPASPVIEKVRRALI